MRARTMETASVKSDGDSVAVFLGDVADFFRQAGVADFFRQAGKKLNDFLDNGDYDQEDGDLAPLALPSTSNGSYKLYKAPSSFRRSPSPLRRSVTPPRTAYPRKFTEMPISDLPFTRNLSGGFDFERCRSEDTFASVKDELPLLPVPEEDSRDGTEDLVEELISRFEKGAKGVSTKRVEQFEVSTVRSVTLDERDCAPSGSNDASKHVYSARRSVVEIAEKFGGIKLKSEPNLDQRSGSNGETAKRENERRDNTESNEEMAKREKELQDFVKRTNRAQSHSKPSDQMTALKSVQLKKKLYKKYRKRAKAVTLFGPLSKKPCDELSDDEQSIGSMEEVQMTTPKPPRRIRNGIEHKDTEGVARKGSFCKTNNKGDTTEDSRDEPRRTRLPVSSVARAPPPVSRKRK